jgi:hypothetical protein
MADSFRPRGARVAGLMPMLVATAAVLVAAIALTVSDASTVFVVIAWIAVAMVAGALVAVARRSPTSR